MKPARVVIQGCVVALFLNVAGSDARSDRGQPASPDARQPVTADPARPALMRHHFALVMDVHDAVVRGDLETARTHARALADSPAPTGLPAAAGPYTPCSGSSTTPPRVLMRRRGNIHGRLERLEARSPVPAPPPERRRRMLEALDRVAAWKRAGSPDNEEGRYVNFIDRAYHLNEQTWAIFSLERLARTPEFRQAAV